MGKDDVLAEGTYGQVEGSSSSGAALQVTDKEKRSEDGSTDLGRGSTRGSKRQAKRRIWMSPRDCGGDLQWATDDHNGFVIDVELVRESRKELVKFMEGLRDWERSSWEECQARTGRDLI